MAGVVGPGYGFCSKMDSLRNGSQALGPANLLVAQRTTEDGRPCRLPIMYKYATHLPFASPLLLLHVHSSCRCYCLPPLFFPFFSPRHLFQVAVPQAMLWEFKRASAGTP